MFYGKMLREPLKMIACLVGAAMISWKLLALSLLVIPFGAYLVHGISRRMKSASQREVAGMGDVYQSLIETFGSIKTVRIFNREQTERVRFKSYSGALYRMAQRISLYDSILRPVGEMLGIVSISLATLAGAYLVLNRETTLFGIEFCARPMSASSLMMFYALLAGASDPARKMSEILNVLVRGGAACESLFKMFDRAPTQTSKYDPAVKIPLYQEQIVFENVAFAFHADHKVLKQVQLSIPFGQSVAIVGGNGAGKTTLINLLARFYDPSEGRILLDGVDLSLLNPKKLRRQMAWVTQDSTLFKGTVRENIMYGARGCSEQQFLRAAALARVEEFIGRLPRGYDTDVGDGGSRLSAGQRQRVALARAIVANPRILILDEATSQLDGHTEQLVHETLRPFLAGRTTIIITHRQSSIKLADRVLVMEHGCIVSDTPTALAATDSAKFRALFAKSA
jgi:ATP-binding cassette subfamily B protein/subfamily B ATP-binding cassette protein MsbA